MRPHTAGYWVILLLYILTAPGMHAQTPSKDKSNSDSAYAAAVQEYHAYVTPEVGLYRGIQYFDDKIILQLGHPFLGPNVIQAGSVWYGGIEYDDVGMEYNLVKEQLVIMDPFNIYKISLFMDLVDSFALGGYVYFHPTDRLAPSILRSGYCARIHEGRFVLLKRDRKSIENSVISLNNPQYRIEENIHYYILENGLYHAVNTKRELVHALKDRRPSEIRKVMRKSGLEWSSDKETLLLLVAAWYDGNSQSH